MTALCEQRLEKIDTADQAGRFGGIIPLAGILCATQPATSPGPSPRHKQRRSGSLSLPVEQMPLDGPSNRFVADRASISMMPTRSMLPSDANFITKTRGAAPLHLDCATLVVETKRQITGTVSVAGTDTDQMNAAAIA